MFAAAVEANSRGVFAYIIVRSCFQFSWRRAELALVGKPTSHSKVVARCCNARPTRRNLNRSCCDACGARRGGCVAIRLSGPCERSRCAASRKLKPKSYTNSCTKSVPRLSFNLAPRIVQVATRGARVAATRYHSTAISAALVAPTHRGAKKIESKNVHDAMYKKRL